MAFLIGAVLALSVGLLATFIGLDRDRAFYPTVMIVIASYYALFALMGGSTQVLMIESMAIVAFLEGVINFCPLKATICHGQLPFASMISLSHGTKSLSE